MNKKETSKKSVAGPRPIAPLSEWTKALKGVNLAEEAPSLAEHKEKRLAQIFGPTPEISDEEMLANAQAILDA